MFDEVESAVATLERVVTDLEPGVLDGPDAVRLVELFSKGEHVAAAGKALVARRVEQTQAYREGGHRSAAHWLASTTGVTVGAATHSLMTAKVCDALPATKAALVSGQLSEVQAYAIASVAEAEPLVEVELLRSAKHQTVKGLKEHCARVYAQSRKDDAEWDRQLHLQRSVSRWIDVGGVPRMDVRLTPEAGEIIFSALDAETDRIFRCARREGRREPRQAYMHDAMVHIFVHGTSKPIDTRMSLDAAAVARGYVAEGERCELSKIGPIPVTSARRLLADASVTTMIKDAEAITHVTSPNRTIPARLRRYLEETYSTCGRSGCDNTQGLIIDHVVDYAEVLRTGTVPPTTEANAWRLCPWCHDLKHRYGWKIVGTAGHWDLVPPDDPRPPYRPAPP